jgi:hypothetical protein
LTAYRLTFSVRLLPECYSLHPAIRCVRVVSVFSKLSDFVSVSIGLACLPDEYLQPFAHTRRAHQLHYPKKRPFALRIPSPASRFDGGSSAFSFSDYMIPQTLVKVNSFLKKTSTIFVQYFCANWVLTFLS